MCLDENDPEMSTIEFPQHSNWEERSDLTYAPALRKAPLIPDSDHQVEMGQGEVSGVDPKIQGSGHAGGSKIEGSGGGGYLYQRTTSRTLNWYKHLKSHVISETKHTLKLKNGSVLRKSAVAVKPKNILPKKRKPATLKEMLLSAKKGAIESPKSKRPRATKRVPVATYQSDSSDSEDYRPLNITPARLPVEVMARQEAIAAGQGPSSSTLVVEHEAGTRAKPKATKTKQAERGKGSQDRPALVARECLTNSSQEEESGSQSESSGTRKSTRRRKPVDKLGVIMIDNIQGAEKKGEHPGEGNK